MRSRIKYIVPIGASILLLCLTVSSCQEPAEMIMDQETIMLDDDDEDPTPAPEPQEAIAPEEEKEDPNKVN
ncbi:MAG: hypothetical protein AB4352_12885 [Hormoscilla sp.]